MRTFYPFFILTVAFVMGSGVWPVHANIYSWTDGENNRHFTNKEPPPDAENVTLFLECPPPRDEDPQPTAADAVSAADPEDNWNGPEPQETYADDEKPKISLEKADAAEQYPGTTVGTEVDTTPLYETPAEAAIPYEAPYDQTSRSDSGSVYRTPGYIYPGGYRYPKRYGYGRSHYRYYRYKRYPYSYKKYHYPVKKHYRYRHRYKTSGHPKAYRSKPYRHTGRHRAIGSHKHRSRSKHGSRSHGRSFKGGRRR